MYVVIFNYNLPDETTQIYDKLVSDGFDKSRIIVVDNGSDKRRKADVTNFALPVNVRFTGQAFMVLSYLLNFFEFDQLFLITTSAGMLDERNYRQDVDNAVRLARRHNAGFVASSLIGGDTESHAPAQHRPAMVGDFSEVFRYQPIAIVVSRRLLELCQQQSAAYFNLALKRGWGIDRELQYVANRHGMRCYVAKDFVVEWRTNLAHRKNVADEPTQSYYAEAEKEMVTVLADKYGVFWEDKFQDAFRAPGDTQSSHKPRIRLRKWGRALLLKLGLYRFTKKRHSVS